MGAAEKLALLHMENIATVILLYLRLFKFIIDPEQTRLDPKDCSLARRKFVLCMPPLSSSWSSAALLNLFSKRIAMRLGGKAAPMYKQSLSKSISDLLRGTLSRL
jgi:hypothetical protein